MKLVRTSIVIAVFALAAAAALAHPPGSTEIVSVSSDGTAGDNFSSLPDLSGDARFVAFWSLATNLVPDDTNNTTDVFVHDRFLDTIERVSLDNRGRQVGGDTDVLDTNFGSPSLSSDGRFVAFPSSSAELVNQDTNNTNDIFVRDRLAGTTERVSVGAGGEQADAGSVSPEISADGRFVLFTSSASNLVPGDTNFLSDVFVHDRATGTTERISVASDGTEGNGDAGGGAITPDGRFVAFASSASNLVPGDTNRCSSFGFFFDCPDVFLRDRLTGTTTRVSLSNAGEEGVGARLGSFDPAISDDARFIAFVSDVPTLVAGDTNGDQDVFVRDRVAGTTERVNVSSAGAEGTPFTSGSPSISADGRFVAFHSENVNLVPDDTNEDLDVFLRDRLAGTTVRLSVASDGSEGGFENASFFPALSADGQAAAFQSEGDLVPGYSGENVFVHDESPGADLSVAKSDSADPVQRGSLLTYTITAANAGPAATPATVVDTLPARTRFVSASSTAGTCSEEDGIVTCELGTLPAGASATVTIVVKPNTTGTITNTVRIRGTRSDPNQANNVDAESTLVLK